jgi:hypothetical protein
MAAEGGTGEVVVNGQRHMLWSAGDFTVDVAIRT